MRNVNGISRIPGELGDKRFVEELGVVRAAGPARVFPLRLGRKPAFEPQREKLRLVPSYPDPR
jgi:hypothetical protein